MAEYVEKWGDDIDSAVELALKDLKLTRDEVTVTVLEQPSKGFLGLFGSRLARVKVEKKPVEVVDNEKPSLKKEISAESSKEVVKTANETKHESSEGVRTEKKSSYKNSNNEIRGKKQNNFDVPKMMTKFTITAEDTDVEPAQDAPAVKFVEEIVKNMNLDVKAEAGMIDSTLYINLVGKDVGSLIGKRGQTLDSIQYLASIVQNKDGGKHTRVIINAEKYREKREKTLQQLAKRISEKCVRTGKNIRLEPMNPYERKVIHSTLQNHPKVTTRSEGIEPNRRVIVELIKK
jgi:spoIIIJ-associated protein